MTRIVNTIRTFIASCIVPGSGFWIVGERKLGIIAALLYVGLVLVFSWTRLVLDPVAYTALIALALGTIVWSAFHSAIIEFRRIEATALPRQWKVVLMFIVVVGAAVYALLSNRTATLGYDVYRLPSRSMAPTLVSGDHVVVDSWHYRTSDPAFGEIATFELPNQRDVIYIKRVVGLPGDTLTFEKDKLIRNGVAIDEPYAYYTDRPVRPMSSFGKIEVPDGEYFVMGDNRHNSRDSRYIGTIPIKNFVGRAVHLWYSNDPDEGIQWDRFPSKIQ